MSTQGYRDLVVWQMAMDLVIASYDLTTRFPPHERYGLSNQVRRAAVSVPANIAEGNGRIHRGEYTHHISIARGSLQELATHLEIARRLKYVGGDDLATALNLMGQLSRMLYRLAMRLKP